MRSGLQPVAISCNKNFYYEPFAALVDPQALSENGSHAPNVLSKLILCNKTNFAELGFSDVRPKLLYQLHASSPDKWETMPRSQSTRMLKPNQLSMRAAMRRSPSHRS
jgi:hypothetical protein